MARVTDAEVEDALDELRRLLERRMGTGPVTLILHQGSASVKVSNKLVITSQNGSGRTYSQQVWPDAMAGYSKRDALNALRLMTGTTYLIG